MNSACNEYTHKAKRGFFAGITSVVLALVMILTLPIAAADGSLETYEAGGIRQAAAGAAPTQGAEGDTVVRYYRTTLSGDELELYDKIVSAVLAGKSEVSVHASKELFDRVFDIAEFVLNDYPELQWCYEFGKMNYRDDITAYNASLLIKEKYSGVAKIRLQKQIDAYVNECISALSGKSDYEKVLGVYEYVINNTVYDLSCYEQSLVPVCTQGRGVCAGYQRTTQYMLQQLGITCFNVSGADHGWNYVMVDGEWYQLDTTWGDPLTDDGSQVLIHDYFLVTDEEMERDHTIEWPAIELPACTATENNYYHKNGRYLESLDRELLVEWIREAEDGALEFRCADAELYGEVKELLSSDELWTLMDEAGTDATDVYRSGSEITCVVSLEWT